MKKILIGVVIGVVVFFGASTLIQTFAQDRAKDLIIEKDKAEELDIELNFGAGELSVSGDADEWVEGKAEYSGGKHKPKVEYKLKRNIGNVEISQSNKSAFGFRFGESGNRWDIELTNEIPVSLQVNVGAAETKLDLKGLILTDLEVNTGVGDTTIDLSGDWDKSFKADFNMGVGNSTIILPENVGIKLSASKGIGMVNMDNLIAKGDGVYVNEAYENADVIIDVKAEVGIGNVDFIVK